MTMRRQYANRKSAQADFSVLHVLTLKPCRVVLYLRVSGRRRWKKLKVQLARLKKKLEPLGFVVVAVFKEAVSGQVGGDRHRVALERAALQAKELDAILVTTSIDRFVRGLWWWKKGEQPPEEDLDSFLNLDPKEKRRLEQLHKRHLLPDVSDFLKLKEFTFGVKLATLIDPNLNSREVCSEATRQGLDARRQPGDLKQQRVEQKPAALRLREEGYSYRAIGRALDRPLTTIYKWLRPV